MIRARHLPVALGVALVLAPSAHARADFSSCRVVPGTTCAQVDVPLDRTGSVSGSVGLHVVRLKARRPTQRALVYLAGGPGGAATGEFVSALADRPIRRLRKRYHLVTFDQRGTGRSGLLRCPELERDPRLRSTRAGADCAAQLGEARAFYTTLDTVADLEALRTELGVKELFLYGVSYGTKVALEYARRFPQHVDRLLLDSVVDPDDTDAFGLEPFRNLQTSLLGLCPRGCGGVTDDPVGDIAALTARLAVEPVEGITPLAIADLLFDADYAPELRSGVPAAVRSLLDHDNPDPLARLLRAARPLAETGSVRQFSSGRYATTCEETPLPWERSTPMEGRVDELRRRAEALGPDAFAPFDLEVARADEIDLCLEWPDVPKTVSAPVSYPDVPALLLQGGEDLRTPATTSLRVGNRLADAQRVLVPGVGHAVLSSDPSGCAHRALRRWLGGRDVEQRCDRVRTGVPPAPVVPASLDSVEPARGLSGAIGRTVAGISLTLEDLGFVLSPALAISPRTDGLARGRVAIGRRALRLKRFSAVTGLWLRGRVSGRGVLRARVGGARAARGRIRVSPSGRMYGRLGGKRVRASLEASGRTRAAIARAVG